MTLTVEQLARSRVHQAVERGQLVRPAYCDRCKQPTAVHGHHPDHSRPLDVDWLCPRCHVQEHRPAPPGGNRRVPIVAPVVDLDRLREIAEANHRTFSQELRHLIAKRIAEHDGRTAA